ncbi:MAG: transcription antitermination factor NusB [Candidatus Gastranaerophilales bacterium]|nr:transcription antitermination factor NusB [Candidatus Gastranaerophilales bacterium]
MGRHELREQIFKLLFRVEFNTPEDMPEQVRLFVEDTENPVQGKDAEYVSEKYGKIQEKIETLDRLINENTTGWDTQRMGKVELTLLRLAVYEVLFDEDIPASVAINEAVELAKVYGQDASGGFVNAILAKIVKLGD